MWRKKYYENPRRLALAAIAKETQETTPIIASGLPHLDPARSEDLDLATLAPLEAAKCPRFTLSDHLKPGSGHGTTVRVFNQDSFDAAIAMPSSVLNMPASSGARKSTQTTEAEILNQLKSCAAVPSNLTPVAAARVAVLNMASERSPGGGWLKGASAQEEALCFRSTLAASLHRNLFYPIAPRAGLYTRDVVIFRTSVSDGHQLMVPETAVTDLPVVGVLSVAGLRRPEVKREDGMAANEGSAEEHPEEVDAEGRPEQPQSKEVGDSKVSRGERSNGKHKGKDKGPNGPLVFADPAARELTKDKMRLCLRMAAAKGHTMLVLGALGCGAFRNPPREIANCWWEVLSEAEFVGGWFKEIWFAVYDRRNEGNFEIFRDLFDCKVVGQLPSCSPSLQT